MDQLTGGAFAAATSGDRAIRLRDWLATEPALEPLQEVYREMSARDKGAAKVLKERLDELKRAREQDALIEQGMVNLVNHVARQVIQRELHMDSSHVRQVLREAEAHQRLEIDFRENWTPRALQQIAREQGKLMWGVIPAWGVFYQPLALLLFFM